MSNLSFIERRRYFLLIPFFYAFFSRMLFRGFLFNAATLWVPGLILTWGLSTFSAWEACVGYFAAYLLFIAIYEVGYFINDTLGVRHDSAPRRRLDLNYSTLFALSFLLVRLVVAMAIAVSWGYVTQESFWWNMGALLAVIALHNTLRRKELKLVTFFQMSALRFATPVILAINFKNAVLILTIGVVSFVFLRFLTYQESKNALNLPGRRALDFALSVHICFLPLILFLYILSGEPAVLWVWVYLIAFGCMVILLPKLPGGKRLAAGPSGDNG